MKTTETSSYAFRKKTEQTKQCFINKTNTNFKKIVRINSALQFM